MTRHLALVEQTEMHRLGVTNLRNSRLLRAIRALILRISVCFEWASRSTQTYSEIP